MPARTPIIMFFLKLYGIQFLDLFLFLTKYLCKEQKCILKLKEKAHDRSTQHFKKIIPDKKQLQG